MTGNRRDPAARAAAATKRYAAAKTPTTKANAVKSVRKNVADMQRQAKGQRDAQ